MSDHPERFDPDEERAARLTAFVLGELCEDEQRELEPELSESDRAECDELERLAVATLHSDREDSLPERSAELREAIESKLANDATTVTLEEKSGRRRTWLVLATSLSLLFIVASLPYLLWSNLARSPDRELADLRATNEALRSEALRADDQLAMEKSGRRIDLSTQNWNNTHIGGVAVDSGSVIVTQDFGTSKRDDEVLNLREEILLTQEGRDAKFSNVVAESKAITELQAGTTEYRHSTSESLGVAYEARRQPKSTTYAAPTTTPQQATPYYVIRSASEKGVNVEPVLLEQMKREKGTPPAHHIAAGPNARGSGAAAITWGRQVANSTESKLAPVELEYRTKELSDELASVVRMQKSSRGRNAGEQYLALVENRFAAVSDMPLSTFSIDVDTASYANARRFLSQNQLPPVNAIRIEEFINYFSYDYPAPKEDEPFSVNLEVAECPWQPAHQLVRIGLKGKEIPQKERPPSNVVFLLDVSGSMQNANKLPLLKQAMKLLTDQLTESDRVSIVTYAGNAGLALDTTNGESKQTIRDSIDALNANGSTNGSAGIQLAYEKATESFIKDGANRVILATDGDLNVGVTSDDALVELIKEKAASGVFLTVLGFGEGNLQDGKLEKLADNGNGMYAYIDSLREARKVLVEQITGSLVTIAKDVKIKVEFNPAEVAAYRLLGYENRLMSAPDFDNDQKDAGEIGAGHTVTALYEVVPTKIPEQFASTAPSLKYQRTVKAAEPPKELTDAAETGELLTLFLRYKQPDANESTLAEFTVASKRRAFDDTSMDFRFAASVASFGMLLRGSEFAGDSSLAGVEEIASSAIGKDPQGHRTEFLDLVRKASSLQPLRR